MARKVRDSKLESRSARLKLKIRRKPYTGPSLARGVSLLYRRNQSNGSWVVKASDGHGAYWTRSFGDADDYEESDGKQILTFYQAQDKAKELARGGDAASDTAPITLDGALDDYEIDLKARGAHPRNATWPRARLPGVLLTKPVQLLTSKELRKWRDGLLAEVSAATVNRLCNCVCAALELAAKHDRRIRNRDAWEIGLAGLPNAQTPRNVVMPDAKVREFVTTACVRDPAFGLLIEVLATTGARPSQAVRLRVEDLHDHSTKPRLMMPKSAKGGGRNRAQRRALRFSIPITLQLSARLKTAAKSRAPDALLLVRADGSSWGPDPSAHYWRDVREIVASIGLDPDVVTAYALRHSSIVRMLLRNVPVRVVAALHDTSVTMIEKNYSAHITEHSDEVSRVALLQESSPAADNVALMPSGRRA